MQEDCQKGSNAEVQGFRAGDKGSFWWCGFYLEAFVMVRNTGNIGAGV